MIEPLLIDRLPMTIFHFRSSPRLLTHAVAALARRALDFVYPPICLACDRAVADPDALCAACWSGMSFIEQPYCERLGTPFDQEFGEGMLSPAAIAEPPDYGRARAAVRYEDETARRMVHGLKYGDRMELARPMARWMVRAGRPLLSEAEVIVPMPLHRSRLIRRRFNQAAELAREISAATDVPWDPFLLQRTKATTPQVGLTRAQRAINVRGAFAVRKAAASRARGRRIVLVDDVLTSGASLNAAARALTRAGAATVDALVFARVVNEAGPTI